MANAQLHTAFAVGMLRRLSTQSMAAAIKYLTTENTEPTESFCLKTRASSLRLWVLCGEVLANCKQPVALCWRSKLEVDYSSPTPHARAMHAWSCCTPSVSEAGPGWSM